MSNLTNIIKMVAVLVAALVIGNWFLAEIKKGQRQGSPWYQPYYSIPGILILLAILFPIILWVVKKWN